MQTRSISLLVFLVSLGVHARADLVHHWRFDEEEGLVAADCVGGSDGRLVGFDDAGDGQWVPGEFGGACDLGTPGAPGWVEVDLKAVDASATGGFTIAMWLNPGDFTSSPGEFQLLSTPGDSIGFTIMNNTFEDVLQERVLLFWDGSLPEIPISETSLEPGEWYHVAITSTGAGGEKRIFVNGVEEPLTLLVPSQGGSGVGVRNGWPAGVGRIGAINQARTHNSIVDDVRIYDEALSEEEIDAIQSNPPAPAPGFDTFVPPAGETFHEAGDGFHFDVVANGAGTTIDPGMIAVVLNGVDVTGDLVIGGTDTRRAVSYESLEPETAYEAVISVSDSAGGLCQRTHRFATAMPSEDGDLLHHFPFDETAGTQAIDIAGGAVGQLVNFEANDDAQWVEGQEDGALDLGADGSSNNFVEFDIQALSAFETGGFTIAMWLKPGDAISSPGEYQLLSTPGDAVGFTIMNGTFEGTQRNRVLLFWDGSPPNITVSVDSLEPGQWYHVALTSGGGGGERQFYINGLPAEQELLLPSQGGAPEAVADGWGEGIARIGSINGGRTHNSVVDDVRIYSRLLEEDEIEELVPFPPPSPLQISNLSPADGDAFHDAASGFSFDVSTPNAGAAIDPGAISVMLNGSDISGDLVIGGTETTRSVSFGGLAAGEIYSAEIHAEDSRGGFIDRVVSFGTLEQSVEPGLVHHFKLDERAGSIAIDLAGGAIGTLRGFVNENDAQWVQGAVGGALDLGADESTDNAVEFPIQAVNALDTGGFTIALWVNPGVAVTNPGEYQLVNTPGDAIGFTIMNNTFEGILQERVLLFWDGAAAEIPVGTTILEPGEWYHVAITSTGAGGEKLMYVNGEPEETVLLLPSQGGTAIGVRDGWNAGTAKIGAFGAFNARGHDSIVDDVRIYNEALDADRIAALVDSPPQPEIRRGDVNDDAQVNIADMIYMLNGLFGDGAPPSCAETGDVNGDTSYNIADPIFGLNRLFGDGPPPIGGAGPDGTDCGPDPDPASSLGCESYTSC